MLPVFHPHSVDILGDRSIDVTPRRALVEDAGVEPATVPVSLEQLIDLVVREPKDILELLDGEDLESHLRDAV